MSKNKRKGSPPKSGGPQDPGELEADNHDPRKEYPVLSFRFLQRGWGFDELTNEQCRHFLCKWGERSKKTWRELSQHQRHALGSELLPKNAIRARVPERFTEEKKFLIFRHQGNLPMGGVRVKNIYYVLWIEKKFGELYDH
ncbi:hypothetical protein AALF15_01455 [Corynebacteriaceae bacterium 7-707]